MASQKHVANVWTKKWWVNKSVSVDRAPYVVFIWHFCGLQVPAVFPVIERPWTSLASGPVKDGHWRLWKERDLIKKSFDDFWSYFWRKNYFQKENWENCGCCNNANYFRKAMSRQIWSCQGLEISNLPAERMWTNQTQELLSTPLQVQRSNCVAFYALVVGFDEAFAKNW